MTLEGNATGSIADCRFAENQAHKNGASAYLQDSAFSVQQCRFTTGSAKHGGGIYAQNSRVSIEKTSASDLSARENGAFIAAEAKSSVIMAGNLVSTATSRRGGAVFLSDSDLKARDTHISQCIAETYGGAISGSFSSRFLCRDCVLENNNAEHGGAISFEYSVTNRSLYS